jgi:hypothetical protein
MAAVQSTDERIAFARMSKVVFLDKLIFPNKVK